jgi:CheY-like chemotaxis protein
MAKALVGGRVPLNTNLFPSLEARPFFTVAETARLLGISVPGVHVWIRKGRFAKPARTSKRGRYRIPRSQIVRLLKSVGREVPGLWTREKVRVLLIDDSPELRSLVAEVFRDPKFGVALETAPTPEDGLLLAGKFLPRVILLDAFSPKAGMTSVQVLAILRGARALGKIRIVGLYPERNAARGTSATRADRHLPKPFSVVELREAVLGARASRLTSSAMAVVDRADRRLWEYRVARGSASAPIVIP